MSKKPFGRAERVGDETGGGRNDGRRDLPKMGVSEIRRLKQCENNTTKRVGADLILAQLQGSRPVVAFPAGTPLIGIHILLGLHLLNKAKQLPF